MFAAGNVLGSVYEKGGLLATLDAIVRTGTSPELYKYMETRLTPDAEVQPMLQVLPVA